VSNKEKVGNSKKNMVNKLKEGDEEEYNLIIK